MAAGMHGAFGMGTELVKQYVGIQAQKEHDEAQAIRERSLAELHDRLARKRDEETYNRQQGGILAQEERALGRTPSGYMDSNGVELMRDEVEDVDADTVLPADLEVKSKPQFEKEKEAELHKRTRKEKEDDDKLAHQRKIDEIRTKEQEQLKNSERLLGGKDGKTPALTHNEAANVIIKLNKKLSEGETLTSDEELLLSAARRIYQTAPTGKQRGLLPIGGTSDISRDVARRLADIRRNPNFSAKRKQELYDKVMAAGASATEY
jgi:hypothetical protein